jgi:uncharacterized protein (DUF2147 family)
VVVRLSRPRLFVAALVALALNAGVAGGVWAQATMNPVGTWLTEGGHGVITIAPCSEGICGTIVGIDRSPNEAMPTDASGRSQCGLRILTGSADPHDGVTSGLITDPRDGKTYQARLWVTPDGNLHLRGFIGVPLLGATQVWRPFVGHIDEECRFT